MRGGKYDSSDLNVGNNVDMHEKWRRDEGTEAREYVTSSRLDIWYRL